MNARTTRLIKTAIVAAAAGLAADTASAQVASYDRMIRAQDVTITPTPDNTGYYIAVQGQLTNHTADPLDLSCTVTVTVNGGPGPGSGPVGFRIVMTGQLGYSCDGPGGGACNGGCSGEAVCSKGGTTCGCFWPMGLVTAGPFQLHNGDVILAQVSAMPGSLPEIDTSDDATQVVFTGGRCPADFNGDHVATVQDIFDFLSAWFAHSPAADFNNSGAVTVQDIFDFLSAWFLGCH